MACSYSIIIRLGAQKQRGPMIYPSYLTMSYTAEAVNVEQLKQKFPQRQKLSLYQLLK